MLINHFQTYWLIKPGVARYRKSHLLDVHIPFSRRTQSTYPRSTRRSSMPISVLFKIRSYFLTKYQIKLSSSCGSFIPFTGRQTMTQSDIVHRHHQSVSNRSTLQRLTTTTSTGTSTEDISFLNFAPEKKTSCNSAIHWRNIPPVRYFQRRFSAFN